MKHLGRSEFPFEAVSLDAKAGWGYQLVKIRREYRSLLATRAVAIGANEIAVTFTPSCLK